MDCDRIIDATFLCFDNEMDSQQRVEFEEHLSCCLGCSRRREVVVACLLLIRHSPACRCQAPRSLELRIRRRIQERANLAKQSGSASQGS